MSEEVVDQCRNVTDAYLAVLVAVGGLNVDSIGIMAQDIVDER